MSSELATVAQAIRIDAMTAELVTALRSGAVAPVLLKGPVVARRLYPDGVRAYADCDLLVAPHQRERAEAILMRLGYAPVQRAWETPKRLEHDAPWRRPGAPGTLDLHRTLPGVRGVSPEAVWRHLEPHHLPWRLPDHDEEVAVLDDAGLALLLALHLAHHLRDQADVTRPLADLERAVAQIGPEAWRGAARLARALRAEAQMARGLCAVAGGAQLAGRLALPPPASDHQGARGVERLVVTRGAGARAALLLRALVPPPSYLRWCSSVARRGRAGLMLAYLVRPVALAGHVVRSVRARRRLS